MVLQIRRLNVAIGISECEGAIGFRCPLLAVRQ